MVTTIKKGQTKKEIEKILSAQVASKSFDARKHLGVIKLKESPIEIQKKMRNEWT